MYFPFEVISSGEMVGLQTGVTQTTVDTEPPDGGTLTQINKIFNHFASPCLIDF